ncbi:hypothetical protein A1O3_00347 [Capronia epimyces CBS 606.96]|uniref:Fungal death-pathway protein SesB domain-containing protein n=1 Tax=Capronia epimyces CBS 606.96 TaxID=1182542 RepID=W9YFY5_9EURO|nr:uncharacterized protein A1O3_00347 [Capronia epimyces CBS 606.96]EXJ91797.1 hypothetical protein A1O3_00347 [Capronia epimyces CBS 606.96]
MAHIPVQFSGDNNRGLQVGSNLGMINYYSQNAIIPFRRDREFVEREVLSELWQRASTPAARARKTQIAIEYAYRVRDQHPDTWVFWVHGSTVARFEESFKMIAERLQLAGWGEPKADILGMVYRWLSDESNGRWTMVVDNADSTDVMFMPWNGAAATQPITSTSPAPSAPVSSTDRSLSDYLPSSPHGSIIITSRFQDVAEGLIECRRYPQGETDGRRLSCNAAPEQACEV